MTRGTVICVASALMVSAVLAAAGFQRQAAAGLVTFLAIFGCGAPRSALLGQAALTCGLITATAPGPS